MALEMSKLDMEDGFSFYAGTGAAWEAKFIYKEIFQDRCYDVATLPSDAFIVDAGGNIGLASIYMKQKYPQARIMAFEPAPVTSSIFQRNLELHKITGVTLHRCGLGSQDSEQTLTFYPDMPGNSTLHNDEKDSILRLVEEDHFIAKALSKSEQVQIPIKRLSEFLHQVTDLKRIDLLKIDVEGAELDVLKGLDQVHWEMLQNVALEICDRLNNLSEAEALLQDKGFRLTKEKAEWSPDEYPMYLLVGKR